MDANEHQPQGQNESPDVDCYEELVIAGVGNLLRSDDGVGVHAVRALERDRPAGAAVVDVGTAILQTLGFFERARRALVIDAVQGGQAPGTIYLFELSEGCGARGGLTLHSMGIKEALKVAAPEARPPRITVLGVEPEKLEYGLELSAAVQAVLPRVVVMAREWTESQRNEPRISRI